MKPKNYLSFFTCVIISLVLIGTRFVYSPVGNSPQIKVTTWDALGYYIYLPAHYIYHDETKLNWLDSIDKKYNVTGGNLYQASKQENGNYVFKYLKGVSHLQLPFFLLAHQFALQSSKYAADGFSEPYQYAIAFGCIFYCIIALFFLRKILLHFYDDRTTSITLLALLLASNFIQYVSIDGGQSHAYIFPLYVFIIYTTMQWHQNKNVSWIFTIGYIIGLAAISRPTEAVMLFIPLLWNVSNWKDFKEKINFIVQNHIQLIAVLLGIIVAILPQLLYWKRATNSYVFDVGSKWDFLNPHFRVLFGFEKGWFIYTPITIFFIIGFFFIKNKPFSKSVITFCLLNIYIIIAWHIWRYGGSYSTRALVQSYPVFALPLAAFVHYALSKKWKYFMLLLFAYFMGVNLFQIKQYNKNIIHYDDMNFNYYKAIYLKNKPTPLDMSLLDTAEIIDDESKYQNTLLFQKKHSSLKNNDTLWILQKEIPKNTWLKFHLEIEKISSTWNEYFYLKNKKDTLSKIRLANPLMNENKKNIYEFYKKIETTISANSLYLTIEGNTDFIGSNLLITITEYKN